MANIDDLFKNWKKKPTVFSPKAIDGFVAVDELEIADPTKTGYPGPRARLPVPDSFEQYSSLQTSSIIKAAKERGLHKIVIAYPTKDTYLEESKGKCENYRFFSSYKNIHWAELARLDQKSKPERKLVSLHKKARDIIKQAKKNNIAVEFMPMVKLTERSALQDRHSIMPAIPIRFWTASPPSKDAVYVFFDDAMAQGATVAGMSSLLIHHGVPPKNLLGSIIGEQASSFKQDAMQKDAVRFLRENHPDTAARADIMLNLIGIDGMEALVQDEAYRLGINSKTSSIAEIEERLQELNSKDYSAILEPDKAYVDRLKKVGLTPEARIR